MRSIFISYRREDSEGQAGRLFDDLVAHFGEASVFMDVAAIAPGTDFREAIDANVAECGVLLALIGQDWLTATDESGQRRIDHAHDFVRLETASALKRKIPVVPVLVQGAKMPRPEQLPPDLADLAFRNAVELSHARWESDVQLLVKALAPSVGPRNAPEPASPPRPARKQGMKIAAAALGVVAAGVAAFVINQWRQPDSGGLTDGIHSGTASPAASNVMADKNPPAAPVDGSSARQVPGPVSDRPFFLEREVTTADLEGKSDWELDLMRNEIYARHGRRFARPELQRYFEKQPWYTAKYDASDFPVGLLTPLEIRNSDKIQAFQKGRRPAL